MNRKDFLKKVENYIISLDMISRGDRVILGISGGADSVCLFSVLLNLKEKYGLTLLCVHVNHGIRGKESDRDERFVEELCKKNNVELKIFKVNVKEKAEREKLSLEEAGRILRYDIFGNEAKMWKADKIAVAHHENDQAETVLFNMLRGSGLRGLTGIHPVNGKIIRPLLSSDRREIEEYIRSSGLCYCTDSTNSSTDYKRNLIRNDIFPVLTEKVNNQAVHHTARLAAQLLETEAFMDETAREKYRKCCHETENRVYILRDEIKKYPDVIQKRVLMLGLEAMAGRRKDITNAHIEGLKNLLFMDNGKRFCLPYGLYGVRETYKGRDVLTIADKNKENKKKNPKPEIQISLKSLYDSGENLIIFNKLMLSVVEKNVKNVNIPKNDYTKWFDYDKISESVCLRTRKTGDYMVIDSKGHKKRLKEIFINEKYSVDLRDEQLLLADGSHIIWILGGRISEAYKVTEDTKRILAAELLGRETDKGWRLPYGGDGKRRR